MKAFVQTDDRRSLWFHSRLQVHRNHTCHEIRRAYVSINVCAITWHVCCNKGTWSAVICRTRLYVTCCIQISLLAVSPTAAHVDERRLLPWSICRWHLKSRQPSQLVEISVSVSEIAEVRFIELRIIQTASSTLHFSASWREAFVESGSGTLYSNSKQNLLLSFPSHKDWTFIFRRY